MVGRDYLAWRRGDLGTEEPSPTPEGKTDQSCSMDLRGEAGPAGGSYEKAALGSVGPCG